MAQQPRAQPHHPDAPGAGLQEPPPGLGAPDGGGSAGCCPCAERLPLVVSACHGSWLSASRLAFIYIGHQCHLSPWSIAWSVDHLCLSVYRRSTHPPSLRAFTPPSPRGCHRRPRQTCKVNQGPQFPSLSSASRRLPDPPPRSSVPPTPGQDPGSPPPSMPTLSVSLSPSPAAPVPGRGGHRGRRRDPGAGQLVPARGAGHGEAAAAGGRGLRAAWEHGEAGGGSLRPPSGRGRDDSLVSRATAARPGSSLRRPGSWASCSLTCSTAATRRTARSSGRPSWCCGAWWSTSPGRRPPPSWRSWS